MSVFIISDVYLHRYWRQCSEYKYRYGVYWPSFTANICVITTQCYAVAFVAFSMQRLFVMNILLRMEG